MARDLRMSIADNPDRCWLYPSTCVENNQLVKDAQPITRFNKTDIVPFAWKRITINGNLTNARHLIGTIQTNDIAWQARPDMFIKDQTGMLFIIDEISADNDENKSKNIGTRPVHVMTMVLRGLEIQNG